MTLRTMLVDDEPLARDLLQALLAIHEDIDLVAQCQDGQEAISHLQAKPVDLLFLDVQMPELDGFEVVERVGLHHLPPTIFVTAYHDMRSGLLIFMPWIIWEPVQNFPIERAPR